MTVEIVRAAMPSILGAFPPPYHFAKAFFKHPAQNVKIQTLMHGRDTEFSAERPHQSKPHEMLQKPDVIPARQEMPEADVCPAPILKLLTQSVSGKVVRNQVVTVGCTDKPRQSRRGGSRDR